MCTLTDLLVAFDGNLHTANMCKCVWADERVNDVHAVH